MPSLKNTVSVFYHFSCKPRDVRYYFSLICIILKRHYKIFQKENAILLYFERKSNYFLFHSISNHQVLRQQGPNKFTNGRNKISLKPPKRLSHHRFSQRVVLTQGKFLYGADWSSHLLGPIYMVSLSYHGQGNDLLCRNSTNPLHEDREPISGGEATWVGEFSCLSRWGNPGRRDNFSSYKLSGSPKWDNCQLGKCHVMPGLKISTILTSQNSL